MFKYANRKQALQHPCLWMLFTCLAVFSMVACGGGASGPGPAATSTPTPSPTPTPFKVTGVDVMVNPTSIAGMACGTAITVTYTATFHIAANSPGGPVQFLYTWNNGRASPSASITVGPGKTTATYAFTWSGKLPADHTLPSYGGVIVTSPNAVNSPLVKPAGMCS